MVSFMVVAAFAATPESAAEAQITAAGIRAHVRFLASDALEGRGPATLGDELAMQYVATELEGLGLSPGAPDGGWIQRFDMTGVEGAPSSVRFAAADAGLSLSGGVDVVAVSGHQGQRSKLSAAELVFVGYGITAPEFGWDDFKGQDLRGKVLLVMNNDPESDPSLFGGKARLWYGRWDYKYERAKALGAAGCLIIHTTPSAGYPWSVVQSSWTGEQFSLPARGPEAFQVKGWLTEDASRKVAALGGFDLDELRVKAERRDFRPVPLRVKVSADFANRAAVKSTGNVLGVLRGSDPTLKDELVVFTAHHDHLGRRRVAKTRSASTGSARPEASRPAPEDEIYNGAVDNASGVAGVLAIARAFAALLKPPRRSILFAVVAAEEQGLLGSQYLVEHPPVPVSRIAADINLDGLNIWGRTKDVSVIGLGKSSLDGVLARQAALQGRVVKPDALPERGYFYRSDQFNFAKAGVPGAYFSSGQDFVGRPPGWGKQRIDEWVAAHYHRPSDELTPDWELSGAEEDVRLAFRVGLEIANASAPPVWNKGDEFEAARSRLKGTPP